MRKVDYRHFLCAAITLGFIACGVFIFPNAICRIAESGRDVGISTAYLFTELFTSGDKVALTVNDMPSWQLTESRFAPLDFLPNTWEEFETKWSLYWDAVFSKVMFLRYIVFVVKTITYVATAVGLFPLFWGVFFYFFKRYISKKNNSNGEDSKGVRRWKRIFDYTYRPVKAWLVEFVGFIRCSTWWKIWLGIWAYNFNVIAIALEFLAFYLYFIYSLDVLSIYTQVYKLVLDLTPMIRFIPGIIWAVIIIVGLEVWAHHLGYKKLRHRERKNRGLINERGIVTTIDAVMGGGKTELMTDMGLSCEVELRDRAFDIIVECDFLFPYFPWIKLERELKIATAFHVTYDLNSIRRWVRKKYQRWCKNMCPEKIFGYDYERYGLFHNDKLKIENIWQVIEDYACAYFIYAVQCSLIISNYSVRSDVDKIDFGNFVRFNTDFFRRDPRMAPAYSRRSKILDFDMLRFGKRVLKNNPNRHALGFGVYLITEIDKERKNQLELKSVDRKSEDANQQNDLFNPLLKMIRHACVVRNRVFIFIITDLQRPEDWGAGGREVGELMHVTGQEEKRPVLPFFAPFWTFELLFLLLFNPFLKVYYDYRVARGDNTSLVYGMHGAFAKLKEWYDNTCNTFDSIPVNIDLESGRMDGERVSKVYYKSPKKTRSERYETACLQGMFEQYAADNTVGIMDLDEYSDKMATQEELRKQHSYFQDDVYKAQLVA